MDNGPGSCPCDKVATPCSEDYQNSFPANMICDGEVQCSQREDEILCNQRKCLTISSSFKTSALVVQEITVALLRFLVELIPVFV